MKAFVRVLFVLIFFNCACGFAQEIEWQKTFGGNLKDAGVGILQAKDGGYYCGGHSESGVSGNKTVASKGGMDFWVFKIDSSGNEIWQKDYGGNDQELLLSMYVTTDGGLICGGSTLSNISGDIIEDTLGMEDFLVMKLDTLGNLEWQNRIGGSGYERLTSISQTIDGGYICGGFSLSGISGDKTSPCFGIADYWIVKLDSIGNVEWDKTIGGANWEELYSIIQTSDGGYLCGGSSASGATGNKTQPLIGIEDYFIVKLDDLGNIVWQQTQGGIAQDNCKSLLETDDGGFVCFGTTNFAGTGTITEPSKGSVDIWILKLDTNGNVIWQKLIGGDNVDLIYSISKATGNNVICGATSASGISGDKSETYLYDYDLWIFEIDSIGNIIWQNTIGGPAADYIYTIQSTSDGGIICNGISTSGNGFDKTDPSFGDFDYWIVKLTREYCLIKGQLFIDLNFNDSLDIGESRVYNKVVHELTSDRIAYTDYSGNYALGVLDTGQFQTLPTNINYFTSNPTYYISNFGQMLEVDSLKNFAFQPTGSFDDLCMTITPLGQFRPGFNGSYMLNYENVGSTTQSPTIVFRIFPNVSFVSSSITPSAIYPDSVVWNLSSLSPFQTGQILVTVNLSSTIPIGSILNSYAQIFPIVNDINPSCNNATWEVTVTGSLDPNDISVDQDTLYSNVFPNPPYLDYLIRFQNTGTDTAFTVKILNPIDTMKLDLNSLEFVAASHPMEMRFIYHERNMEFLFTNILLADSNVNEPASHGFVRYKVKPKSNLQVGDSIKNFAAIYFDFNEPVITNTAKTHILLFTGLSEQISTSELFVYPNPSSQEINIQVSNTQGKRISLDVYNLFGQKVKSLFDGKIMSSELKQQFDISSLNQGVYLLQYNVDGVTKSKKIIKW